MKDLILRYKPLIDHKIDELTLSSHQSTLPWAQDVAEALADTTKRGKTVRGSLMLATIDLFSPPHTQEAVSVAVVLEYLHSALLIHDDLIDHDDLRRGTLSMHKAYEKKAEKLKVTNNQEFGKAMSVCIGDIAIFGAFSFLSKISLAKDIHLKIIQFITDEFLLVGFGELHDIALGYQTTVPSSEEVMTMYLHKTARYTFSVPLMVGGMLANQPANVLQTLEHVGEKLGLIFQLTDDQLTLTGNKEETGKTIGNDISENKKTLYHVLLRERASKKENELLNTLFGKQFLTLGDIENVKQLIQSYNVLTDIQKQIVTLSNESTELIETLPLTENNKQTLHSVVSFLQTRER